MLDDLDIIDPDFEEFNKEIKKAEKQAETDQKLREKIEEKKKELQVTTDEELKEKLPERNAGKYGFVEAINLRDIAMTDKGELVKTHTFDKMNLKNIIYGDITFTPDEARVLAGYYHNLKSGVNAVVPLKCTGPNCKFAEDCVYQQMDKAPIGKGCLIEFDMLNFFTNKFSQQYNIDPNDYTSKMLIGELAELLIYEMRLTRVLAESDNAGLMGIRIKFSPDGDMMQEETAHWAIELKDRYKSRKMKIIDTLEKKHKKVNDNSADNKYEKFVSGVLTVLEQHKNDTKQKIENAKFEDIED